MPQIKINIDKRGFNKEVQAFRNKVNEAFESSFNDGTNKMAIDAKAKCVIPSISSTINVTKNGEKEYSINAGQGLPDPDAAAWTEFGTGNPETVKMGESAQEYVKKLTQDWRDYAGTFIRNGLGSIPANPYLYPAFMKMKENLPNLIISKI